jgi:hypothetical protein
MPLTPSHAAAAPLLQRLIRRLGVTVPMSALVVGTMAPDFAYLFRLAPGGGAWHTPLGLLIFCLPAGLVTWWVFRENIGPALLRLLPPKLGEGAAKLVLPGKTYRLIPAAALAILLGALSHDCWDSFTHEARWGVQQVSGLETSIRISQSHWMRGYAILQYASSLIGLLVVAAVIWQWVRTFPRSAWHVRAGERAWRIRDASLLLLSGMMGAILNASRDHPPGWSWTLGFAAVGGMAALAVALLVYGTIDSIRHRAIARPLASAADDVGS